MALYMTRKRLFGPKRFPMVLMLEPLHACNLHCEGCGRIREYPETIHQTMNVQECLGAIDECGAPIVSVCGGEPLLYPELPPLIDGMLRRGKHLYLCSNGLLLADKIRELASIPNRRLRERLYFNIHLDGPARLHDVLTGRPGAFDKAVSGIQAAQEAGFRVYVNSTVYRRTRLDDLIELAETLPELDGLMISPAYGYAAVLEEKTKEESRIFMTREEIHVFFAEMEKRMARYRLTATPIFFDFLCGRQRLDCAAWANPTRNVRGWRSPCYLIADAHYPTWRELMKKTDWSKIGPEHDPRCRDCLTHCGFEPASVLAVRSPSQILRLIRWEFGPF